jgi:hypothetical protein
MICTAVANNIERLKKKRHLREVIEPDAADLLDWLRRPEAVALLMRYAAQH